MAEVLIKAGRGRCPGRGFRPRAIALSRLMFSYVEIEAGKGITTFSGKMSLIPTPMAPFLSITRSRSIS
jgi:hypothetical protein